MRLGLTATEDTLGHQDPLERRVYPEQQARRDPRETRVRLELQERVALLGFEASEGAGEAPEPWALLD